MMLEILKKKKIIQNVDKPCRKKYFGEKENVELNRINQRSQTQQEQEKLSKILNDPMKKSPLYLSDDKRFNTDFIAEEKKTRVHKDQQQAETHFKNCIKHLEMEKQKWDRMNQEYVTTTTKLEKKKKIVESRPFFNNQGFNILNMQYTSGVSGEILKKRDDVAKRNRYMRAENLFNKNNTNYDIFTGKDKNYKDYHYDILDKFIMINKLGWVIIIPIKLLIFYLVSQKAFILLSGEDTYYELRGTNTYCQDYTSVQDKMMCSNEKFDKFFLIYNDSVPFNLFEHNNPYINSNSIEFTLKHQGISDSGPAFSGLMTGKLANKYEGSINKIDNVFRQLNIGGYQIIGYGYDYPIEDMIGREFFKTYQNQKKGLNGICPQFLNLNDVTLNNVQYVIESLIFNEEEQIELLENYTNYFIDQLEQSQEDLFQCLKRVFQSQDSLFLYDVYTDSMGHMYSRQSEFYIRKLAALKANYFLLNKFFESFMEDRLLIIMSDHGLVSSLWESEVSNHGTTDNKNESFCYFYNKNINKKNFYLHESITAYQFSFYISLMFENINVPINSNQEVIYVRNTDIGIIQSLRQKEMQIQYYIKTFEQNDISEEWKMVLDAISPFQNLMQKISNQQKISHEEEQNYKKYVKELENLQAYLLNQNLSKQNASKLFDSFLVILIFILPSLFLVIKNIPVQERKIEFFSLFILIGLQLIFLYKQFLDETLYIPYFQIFIILIFFISLKFKHFFSKIEQTILILILASLLILPIYDKYTRDHNFYFFYYQNFYLQYVLIIVYIAYSIYSFKELNRIQQLNQSLLNTLHKWQYLSFLIIDISVIIYEIFLIYSFDYIQTTNMSIFSKCFYIAAVVAIIFSFNYQQEYMYSIFLVIIKGCFWFSTNYIRIPFFLMILPILLYSYNKRDLIAHKKHSIFIFTLYIYWSFFIFKTLRGEFDTNISVRIAQKNFCSYIEQCHIFTAVLFFINKFLPLIILFTFIFTIQLRDNEIHNIFQLIGDCFKSSIFNLIEIWFGFGILCYFISVQDPHHQRSGFMVHSGNLVLFILNYVFQITGIIYGIQEQNKKYQKVGKTQH